MCPAGASSYCLLAGPRGVFPAELVGAVKSVHGSATHLTDVLSITGALPSILLIKGVQDSTQCAARQSGVPPTLVSIWLKA